MNINPKKRERIPTVTELRAEELARQYVINAIARDNLTKENENISKELIEILMYRGIKNIEIEIDTYTRGKKDGSDYYKLKLTDKRATIVDTFEVMKMLIRPMLQPFIPDVETRKVATDRLSEMLVDHVRKDAILVKKIVDTKEWASKFIKENVTTPYIAVMDDIGRYI